MSKRLLAVFDSDLGYVERFLKYIKSRRGLPFAAVGFSSFASLELFLQRNIIDVLLVSQDALSKECLDKLQEEASVQEIIISGDRQDMESRQKSINRYRSCDRLINDIISICRLDGYEEETALIKTGIIGVYSPVSGIWRQEFALRTARVLSADRSVLYINFDRFCGLSPEERKKEETGLSDLLYFYKTNPKKLRAVLKNAVCRTAGVDILFAPRDMEDMDLLEDAQWKDFLVLLSEYGSYDLLILDMAEAFRKPETIMKICEKVFVPLVKDASCSERFAQLKEYLTEREGEKILEKIRLIGPSDADEEEKETICPAVSPEEIRSKAEAACLLYEGEAL